MTTITQFIDAKPRYIDGDDYGYQYQPQAPVTPSHQQPVPPGAPVLPMAPGPALPEPEPRRTFDLRTSEERLVMWCAALERRIEAQDERIMHLELIAHRLLNAGEVEP